MVAEIQMEYLTAHPFILHSLGVGYPVQANQKDPDSGEALAVGFKLISESLNRDLRVGSHKPNSVHDFPDPNLRRRLNPRARSQMVEVQVAGQFSSLRSTRSVKSPSASTPALPPSTNSRSAHKARVWWTHWRGGFRARSQYPKHEYSKRCCAAFWGGSSAPAEVVW